MELMIFNTFHPFPNAPHVLSIPSLQREQQKRTGIQAILFVRVESGNLKAVHKSHKTAI